MKDTPTQFEMRENTASSRRHASRLAVDSHLKSMGVEEQIPHRARSPYPDDTEGASMLDLMQAASQSAATVDEIGGHRNLLTVYEVADLLQVRVSWVYERTRRHGPEQLPHFKIGKYLRFEERALTDFIQRQRRA
jgi:Helix-turn-helix domain